MTITIMSCISIVEEKKTTLIRRLCQLHFNAGWKYQDRYYEFKQKEKHTVAVSSTN